nr:DUF6070 family protein [Roseburia hominis]
MLLRKTSWFWKSGLAAISFVLILSISGCSDAPPEENTVSETVIDVQDIQEESEEDADEIINICIDLYEKATEENKLADLETIRGIVNRLGENGYSAVDSRNQVNMTEAEQVLEFCEKVDTQEEAEITIIEVSYLGGFVKYDLETKDGNVDVVRSYYKYENGNMKREVTGSYQAEYWNYTEDGYLMFSGVWFSEELYVLTLSGAEEHTALRVQPLDETYRELSRKYLLPIGFEQNNMFIVDWSEDDFGELNFYDMFTCSIQKFMGQIFLMLQMTILELALFIKYLRMILSVLSCPISILIVKHCNPKPSIMQRIKHMNINREDLRKWSIRNTHIQR